MQEDREGSFAAFKVTLILRFSSRWNWHGVEGLQATEHRCVSVNLRMAYVL